MIAARHARRDQNEAPARSRRLHLLLVGQDSQPPERGELVANIGPQHLGAVGADGVPNAVAANWSKIQRNSSQLDTTPSAGSRWGRSPGRSRAHAACPSWPGRRPTSRRCPILSGSSSSITSGDLLDGPRFAHVDRYPQPEVASPLEQRSVVGCPDPADSGPAMSIPTTPCRATRWPSPR